MLGDGYPYDELEELLTVERLVARLVRVRVSVRVGVRV